MERVKWFAEKTCWPACFLNFLSNEILRKPKHAEFEVLLECEAFKDSRSSLTTKHETTALHGMVIALSGAKNREPGCGA